MTDDVAIEIYAAGTGDRSSRRVNRGEGSRAQKPPMDPRAVNKTPYYLAVSVDVHGQRGSSAGIIYGGEGWTRRVRSDRQPEAGQRHAGEADAEFLQRHAARDRLGQAFGEFIELVVHVFPFVCERPHFDV